MIKLYINSVDVTEYYSANTLLVKESLTRRVNESSFIMEDFRPFTCQEVIIYEGKYLGTGVSSGSSVLMSLDDIHSYTDYTDSFRVGDTVTVDLGGTNEEDAEITAVGDNTITVDALSSNHAKGVFIAKKKKLFAGMIERTVMQPKTPLLNYYTYQTECVSYDKKFNRKLVNNAYEDKTTFQIILDILNKYVNYNILIDDLEYTDNAAIQAVWVESNDGDNPTIDTSDYQEDDTSGILPWTNSGGTAVFGNTSGFSVDLTDIVGVTSGVPTNGTFICWVKPDDYTKASSIQFRFGSSGSNYLRMDYTIENNNNWQYVELDMSNPTGSSNPSGIDWSAIDVLTLTIVESDDSQIHIDGIRVMADNYFTFNNVDNTAPTFENARFSLERPTDVIEKLANLIGYDWWLDYDKDLHFVETADYEDAPFELTETSENYSNLYIEPNTDQLVNSVYIQGGSQASDDQEKIYEGNGTDTIFIIPNPPRTIGYDDENAKPIYDFTLETNISGAGYTERTLGMIGIDDPASYEWMYDPNPEGKYIENGTDSVLAAGDLVRMTYTYNMPINVIRNDEASIARMKDLMGARTTDGVVQGKVEDSKIQSIPQALDYANEYLKKYGNPIINLEFITEQEGLEPGQIIKLTNSEFSYTEEPFLIQSIIKRAKSTDDAWDYEVTCASSLFGLVELFKLLLLKDIEIAEDQSIGLSATEDESISMSDTSGAGSTATLDSDLDFKWGADAHAGKWNLGQWG